MSNDANDYYHYGRAMIAAISMRILIYYYFGGECGSGQVPCTMFGNKICTVYDLSFIRR